MAIVKMKHLRLVAMGSDRKRLLHLLQGMGCVEIDEPSVDPEDPVWASLSRPDSGELSDARERNSEAERAVAVLKRSAPEKSKMLQAKPDLTQDQLLDPQAAGQALVAAEEINGAERRINAIHSEQLKVESQKAALAPWLGLDLPLETGSGDQVTIQLGTLPGALPFEEAERAAAAAGELAQLTQVSADREARYCLLVCHASQSQAVLEALKDLGWSRANLRDWIGTAAENTARLDRELEALAGEKSRLEEKLAGMGGLRPALQQLADCTAAEVSREESRDRTLDTGVTFFLEGWIPAERWPELEQALEPYPCAFEATDPAPEEYAQVPVQLKNNWFTRPLNMVTEMYSLPAYGTVDPNPLMAPFFIFFYGFMMADMGYGLLMMLASVIVMKKAKPDGPTMRHMVPLLGLCGVSTFLMGMLTGGFFGDLLPQLAQMINPDTSFTAMPALFSPLDDALAVLIGSLAIGVAQIFTGMAVSMYRKIKGGEVMAALCNEGVWYLVFVLLAGGILAGQVKAALIAILVLLVLTQGYGKKGIVGKIMGIGGSLYNNVTGYFSDILSYSRLMALMLAGAVIAQVFNTLGALTGNVITFFIIAMVGNALNMALNLLGCYVHDMRLQCLEYFGRFYEDGGKPFRPLELNTKYYKVVK
ncbi:V-type ATP synthase subunit I [Pseudoflavonifractor phocaeensis]|uniref:V-type ATP synthase subunit I n=1 Tax=Pseudoflavonifractor phocaeensis TaxID=1870988 RepID=UPI001F3F4331|nr:V-type ATP synthase subunit I [Pseudoflavonifractor phocaeensis]MCF2661654.1 V-type ATP synthase subunit I [Pseudoflavonifractor phocaeensis]